MTKSAGKACETVAIKDPDSDDYFVEFSDEIMQAANLKIGDSMQCEIRGNCISLKKANNDERVTSDSHLEFWKKRLSMDLYMTLS